MKISTFLSVATIATMLAIPGPTFAQAEHMISGKAVPADQVAEVQNKCDELHKAAPGAATPAPGAAAAGTAGWTEDGSKIDLTKLTVALCDEGMFTAPAM